MKNKIVQINMILVIIFALTGCAHVEVFVNSLTSADGLSKLVPIIFPQENSDIDSEKTRKECALGARQVKIDVQDKCTGTCYYAFVSGQTGASSQQIYSSQNTYTHQTSVSSASITKRTMTLKIYQDPEKKTLLYQSRLDSEGRSSSVLSVANQLCQAAFKAFPKEVTAKKYSISW